LAGWLQKERVKSEQARLVLKGALEVREEIGSERPERDDDVRRNKADKSRSDEFGEGFCRGRIDLCERNGGDGRDIEWFRRPPDNRTEWLARGDRGSDGSVGKAEKCRCCIFCGRTNFSDRFELIAEHDAMGLIDIFEEGGKEWGGVWTEFAEGVGGAGAKEWGIIGKIFFNCGEDFWGGETKVAECLQRGGFVMVENVGGEFRCVGDMQGGIRERADVALFGEFDDLRDGKMRVRAHEAEALGGFAGGVGEGKSGGEEWGKVRNGGPDFGGIFHSEKGESRARVGEIVAEDLDGFWRFGNGPVEGAKH
jgi:hypothetical protein